MSLIVEDGTGLEDAESYISVADADIYHERRGNTTWDAIDDKEALLRKATDYMSGKYGLQWAGYRASETQALDWPRTYAPKRGLSSATYHDSDAVPTAIKNACAALALRAYTADLLEDQSRKVLSEQVGPISVTYESSSAGTRYLEIEAMINPFLQSSGGIPMVRI